MWYRLPAIFLLTFRAFCCATCDFMDPMSRRAKHLSSISLQLRLVMASAGSLAGGQKKWYRECNLFSTSSSSGYSSSSSRSSPGITCDANCVCMAATTPHQARLTRAPWIAFLPDSPHLLRTVVAILASVVTRYRKPRRTLHPSVVASVAAIISSNSYSVAKASKVSSAARRSLVSQGFSELAAMAATGRERGVGGGDVGPSSHE
jgi:hypothetical protein